MNKITDLKALKYIQYGWYISVKLSWRFALQLIRQEIAGEKKYGICTTGADELRGLGRSGTDISHATIYMPVSYPLLETALAQIPESRRHFVDIGCGQGRALCVAVHFGFSKVTGIDFSPDFCAASVRNLIRTAKQKDGFQYEVLLQDAAGWPVPDDADCLFFFNPFDAEIMEKVIARIRESLRRNPRKVQIIYVNPLYGYLFTGNGFSENYHLRNGRHLEVSVFSN